MHLIGGVLLEIENNRKKINIVPKSYILYKCTELFNVTQKSVTSFSYGPRPLLIVKDEKKPLLEMSNYFVFELRQTVNALSDEAVVVFSAIEEKDQQVFAIKIKTFLQNLSFLKS